MYRRLAAVAGHLKSPSCNSRPFSSVEYELAVIGGGNVVHLESHFRLVLLLPLFFFSQEEL